MTEERESVKRAGIPHTIFPRGAVSRESEPPQAASKPRARIVIAIHEAERGIALLERRLPGASFVSVEPTDPEGLRTALAEADAVVCTKLTAYHTGYARSLRLVQLLGAGDDEIDRDALPPGCALCNAFGHERSVGEWALMAMLALSRRLLVYDRDLRRGIWHGAVHALPASEEELLGRSVGLIGFGHIGCKIAELATAIGMRAIATTRSPTPDRAGREHLEWLSGMDAVPDLLVQAEFAVVCVPLTSETTGLIGARELELLGPSGNLLNVARGPVVQELALYEALRARTIAGAALDVWYRYPQGVGDEPLPASLPFGELDNVIMTPHLSGWTAATLPRRWEFVAEQLERFVDGLPLRNLLFVAAA